MRTASRRWFRFSLRTLFVVVTVLCVLLSWVVWNWRIVKERQAAKYWLQERLGSVWLDERAHPNPHSRVERRHNEALGPSWLRMKLGDEFAIMLVLPPTLSESEKQHILAIFPEAAVKQWPLKDWTSIAPILKPILEEELKEEQNRHSQ